MASIRSLCVYCGSSGRVPAAHRVAATRLGQLLATNGIELIYGGGRVGLMGLMADAALAAGGMVTGVIPRFLQTQEVAHGGVARLEVTESMHTRKERMAMLADGFVILPGGLGTLDEAFEILTWKQLGLHDKPIVVVDQDGYWQPLLVLVSHMVANGYARPENTGLFATVESVEAVLPALTRMPEGHPPSHPKWL